MKINVLCSSEALAFPSILNLKDKGLLSSVGIMEKHCSRLYPQLVQMGVEQDAIVVFTKENWREQIHHWVSRQQPDCVWVFGFPWIIPDSILNIAPYGFVNFHYGRLPDYKGADPIFWQIKNRENTHSLTIHKMTQELDAGPVWWKEQVPALPGETYGMHCARLGMITAGILDRLIWRIKEVPTTELVEQPSPVVSPFFRRPSLPDITIRWTNQSATDIEALVNATNPKYDGAVTTLRDMEVRILEVSSIVLSDPLVAEPGTIVHADNVYGLIVACINQKFLRIQVLHIREGYISGIKLFQMGIQPGDRFIS